MRTRALPVPVALLLLASAVGAAAQVPLEREQVPEPLKTWIPWAMHGHEAEACPFLLGNDAEGQCLWPSRLALDLGARAGKFSQGWLSHAPGFAPLPGDGEVWPQGVRLDDRPAAVVERDGVPCVWLAPGPHTVTGTFAWDELPEILQVPLETGLLSLTLDGKAVPFPGRDEEGRLWLQGGGRQAEGESRVEVEVHRRVIDEVPLELVTHVVLKVSGQSRELLLGPALLPGFAPMALYAPLPLRLEKDGRLRVQVRPGEFEITFRARHEGPLSELPRPADAAAPGEAQAGGTMWAEEEIWVFDARNHLRLVSVEGLAAVDPNQTTLPADWKRLPAYVARAGDVMKLAERRRGDADPAPDRLNLGRTLWLDFDGGGYTIADRITGTMSRSWRLEMPSPAALGRVAIDGEDQLITRREGAGDHAGVEVRQGRLSVEADSRIDGGARRVPAVGWAHDFQEVSGTLHLPPGFRLIHASGVDRARPTWLSTWNLLDIFLVVLIALAAGKLLGWSWGGLALLAMIATFLEPGSPRWLWPCVLAAEALVRVLPAGVFQSIARLLRLALWIALVIVSVTYVVAEARKGLFPVLEHSMGIGPEYQAAAEEQWNDRMRDMEMPKPAAAPAAEGGEANQLAMEVQVQESTAMPPSKSDSSYGLGSVASRRKRMKSQAERAIVQTGPGKPAWAWNQVSLQWSGTVKQGQQMTLWLLSPRMSALLAFLRIALLGLFVARVMGWRGSPAPGGAPGAPSAGPPSPAAAAMAALVLAALLAPPAATAEIPGDELLEALRAKVMEKPECHPDCAGISRMALEARNDALTLRVEAHAATASGAPLPGDAKGWLPTEVLLDGAPATGLLQSADGKLWIYLPAGAHEVLMSGRMPDREIVQLPLPLLPRRVDVIAEGWEVTGVGDDGSPDDNLQLTREERREEAPDEGLKPDALPPFVRVERELSLDIAWEARTVVRRLTPVGAAIVLEVPLLAGESVTDAGTRVVNGKVQVSLAPQAETVEWPSVLQVSPEIDLVAPKSVAWVESWLVDASPLWHVEPTGIPPVHPGEVQGDRMRAYRPWPGESVKLAVTRPEGVAGQTLTVDRVAMEVKPSMRATDASMTLSLRSSRGGQHVVKVPEGAELIGATINGLEQPLRLEGRDLSIPIVPGAQTIVVSFRVDAGISRRLVSPEVDLGTASVNVGLKILMSPDRWVLLTGGTRVGPVVQFWSLLFIVAILSVVLGRVGATPVGIGSWFLLGVGLTQVPVVVAAIVVGWLLALGYRKRRIASWPAAAFDLAQLALAGWTLLSLGLLFFAIYQGLLGSPDMQIAGNVSTAEQLNFFQDRSAAALPQVWVVSVPLMVYRLTMLAWSLWLAWALLGWLRFGWGAFTEGGLYKAVPLSRGTKGGAGAAPPPATPKGGEPGGAS